MNTVRKSFLLHFDSLEILDELTNEQCGLLFKACRDFNINGEVSLDPVLSLVFFSFKKQFERDQVKYQVVADRNKTNGSKGGRPKGKVNPDKPKEPSGLIDNPDEPRKADSVNGSGNDSDSDSGNKSDSKDISTSTKKHSFSEVDYQCAEWVYSLIVKVAPSSKKPNFESWANTIRLMRESDKLTHDDISNVFTWANNDSFWSVNILSITKLRKQFPQLQAKMRGSNGQHQSNGQKLSAHERVKQRNDAKYRNQPNECGLGVGANDGGMGRTVDEGTGRATIEYVDSGTFVDYDQSS